ncbi:MAG TPA: valine--tRNA ligase [Terriglobia bacterium]|nr:valine--tRNA ligase [Terriglobia bacterium]
MELEIPKVYSPEKIEPRWARAWVEQKLYRPGDDASRPRFCLVIPPPNITGSLHMGHMLEHTEIDILMRWRRMSGDDVLWLPGTDHASIATQMIVEREIGREALPGLEPSPEANRAWQREGQRLRLEMGREKFLERCWKWKEQNGGTIKKQMERLGTSVDWTRERFTMDAAYSRAVNEAFVRLYKAGLIYRAAYVVNWCPRCLTAISDLEVIHEERQGKLWFIRYPFEDDSGFITVATTRPETMLGDAAVAVSPSDQRYTHLVGRMAKLPLVDVALPIIADGFVDPDFGTGAVKVTPAHDPNDFAIAQRHLLRALNVIDTEARINTPLGNLLPYEGRDRYVAREAIVRDLQSKGLIEKEQDHTLSVGKCQRCKTDIEYRLTIQWFMKMKSLAEPAIQVVREGKIKILPESGLKKYLNWMENIHEWCISRQLWWGHRIPAWICDNCDKVRGLPASVDSANDNAIVGLEAPGTCPSCGGTLREETDVLDTWFSSALWPFATLGWPDQTPDLKRFYPNDLMIMGEDILFFWGARMIMMGLKLMGDVPFREFYIHALVRDAERQKMSKTKGNVLDPLEVTEKYGTDAVRFALAISAAPGTDIAFSDDKVQSYRAFANKIWNAGRFILMNLQRMPEPARERLAQALAPVPELGFRPVAAPGGQVLLADRWIFSRLSAVTREINEALENFRFHEAAYTIYHFFWHEFCDWYLEWVKPEVTKPVEGTKSPAAWTNLTRVFKAALHLLHPFMPFITEELWHQLPRGAGAVSLSLAPFRLVAGDVSDPVAEREFESIRELVVTARNAKAEQNLQREKPSAQVASEDVGLLELLRRQQEVILRLAGLTALSFVTGHLAEAIPVNGSLDLRILHDAKRNATAERQRLEREKSKLEQSLAQTRGQLDNQEFVQRAPREVVRSVEQRHNELAAQYEKLLESLGRLNGM